jgi:hypothetical protein
MVPDGWVAPFKMTFADGDTLFGTLHLQCDFSSFPIVLFYTTRDSYRRQERSFCITER